MLTHSNITWMARAMAEGNPVYEADEFLSFLPLCHIFEQLFTIFMNIKYAAIVNFIESTDNLKEASPTVAYGVPRIWEKYYSTIMILMSDATWFKRLLFHLSLGLGKKYAALKTKHQPISLGLRLAYSLAYFSIFRKLKERLGFDRVRLAFSGAAPISPDVLRFFQGIGVPLREGYGMTEGTGVTCSNQGDRVRIGTVGQPLPGVEVKIAEDGEIVFRGGNVFKGYFRDPQAAAEVLQDGWMRSGDVGELDPDGYLKITDREKDLIEAMYKGGKLGPGYVPVRAKTARIRIPDTGTTWSRCREPRGFWWVCRRHTLPSGDSSSHSKPHPRLAGPPLDLPPVLSSPPPGRK